MPKLTKRPRKILDTKCAPSTPPKKSTAQKLESQRTKNGEKKRNEKTKEQNKKTRRHNAKPKGGGKNGSNNPKRYKKIRCCFALSTCAFQVDKAKQHLNFICASAQIEAKQRPRKSKFTSKPRKTLDTNCAHSTPP